MFAFSNQNNFFLCPRNKKNKKKMSKDAENETKKYKDYYIGWLLFSLLGLLCGFALASGELGPEPKGFGILIAVVMFICALVFSYAVHTTEWAPKPDPQPGDPPGKSMPTVAIIGIILSLITLFGFFFALYAAQRYHR
jgi:drug/metabolite transporter (DMT)-like permease